MTTPLGQPGENVQALKGLIGWFNQSSFQLIQEYRRLEERAATLKGQLEAKHRELKNSLYTTISHLLSFAAEPASTTDVLPVASLLEDLQEDSKSFFVNSPWSISFARSLASTARAHSRVSILQWMASGAFSRKRSPRYMETLA